MAEVVEEGTMSGNRASCRRCPTEHFIQKQIGRTCV